MKMHFFSSNFVKPYLPLVDPVEAEEGRWQADFLPALAPATLSDLSAHTILCLPHSGHTLATRSSTTLDFSAPQASAYASLPGKPCPGISAWCSFPVFFTLAQISPPLGGLPRPTASKVATSCCHPAASWLPLSEMIMLIYTFSCLLSVSLPLTASTVGAGPSATGSVPYLQHLEQCLGQCRSLIDLG